MMQHLHSQPAADGPMLHAVRLHQLSSSSSSSSSHLRSPPRAAGFRRCTPATATPSRSSPRPPFRLTTRCTTSPSVAPMEMTKMSEQQAREKGEVVKYLETWAEEEIVPLLKPVEKMWQPQDLLPEAAEEGFMEEVAELRARAAELADEYLVCLVGDTITEEALPTYQTMLYSFVGPPSEEMPTESAWATWVRGWTAEENRHGDVLRQYLYLTGKVDMRMMERTTHYLLASGMDVGLENNPYYGFIYTAFQERATAISHGNTGRKAAEAGDEKLAKICGVIAGDEKRHERAYAKVVEKLLEVDPEGTMLALEVMMRRKIVMPAHLMYDGRDERLFHHFSRVAQRAGVYTAADYAAILSHFVQRWKLESVCLSSSSAIAAQDYVCSLPSRFRKLDERARARSSPPATAAFSWIFNRHVSL